jgi:hypothetical protein
MEMSWNYQPIERKPVKEQFGLASQVLMLIVLIQRTSELNLSASRLSVCESVLHVLPEESHERFSA